MGSIPTGTKLHNNLGQAAHTYVPAAADDEEDVHCGPEKRAKLFSSITLEFLGRFVPHDATVLARSRES